MRYCNSDIFHGLELKKEIKLVLLKIPLSPGSDRDGISIPSSGPGGCWSISQYFLENDNTDETGKR